MYRKVLIFGGGGLLGKSLQTKFRKNELLCPSHKKLDLLNIKNVLSYIETGNPTVVIYLAGITKIDTAEKNKSLALKLNYEVPKRISKFISSSKIPFIYASTDAVFDGYKNKYAFSESDRPNPVSVYGKSKLLGEQSVLENSILNSSVRLINLFGLNENNFVYKMLNSVRKNEEFPGIINQIKNPLYVKNASAGIQYVIRNKLSGIYHLGALNEITNYDLLIGVTKKFNYDVSLIKKITFNEFMKDKIGHRKQNSVLICNKFNKVSEGKILQSIDGEIESLFLSER